MSEYGLTTKGYLTDIVLQKLENKIEFFLNSKLEPMIHVPEDGFQQDWPVNSQRFFDLLAVIFYDVSQGEILKKPERELLLSQIRENCRKGVRRFTHLEAEEAEENPLVQAVLCFVNGHERFDGRTAVLLELLRDSQFADKFPASANNFSQRLKRSIEVLRGYGVEVSIEHREDGSHCRISRMESFAIEPDATLERVHNPDDAQRHVRASSGSSSGGNTGYE